MDFFFHADTTKYRRRLKATVITVLVPLFGVCVFCAVNILLNISSGAGRELITLLSGVIVGCCAVGIITVFVAVYYTNKLTARHNRFTYLDILPEGFVFSLYAGEYRRYSRQVILRKLYLVPFSGLEEISRDPKSAPCTLLVKGEVRYYLCESGRLGYHVDEDDHIQFDSPELNEHGFEKLERLEISGWFGSTKKIERALRYFLDEYRNKPAKKPFNIADFVPKKRQKKSTTSNPLLEAPSYDRRW
ncbi:MAG: hypothetical protein ACI4WS_08280 [Oscillospiraceae bacterium]